MQLLLDLAEMPVYDSAFRKTHTQWALGRRDQLHSVEVLSRSKLVTMGAGVANMVLGGIVRTHTEVEPFDALVRKTGLRPRRG